MTNTKTTKTSAETSSGGKKNNKIPRPTEFEKKAIVRDVTTGLADTISDWVFYLRVASSEDYADVPSFYGYLLILFSVFGTLLTAWLCVNSVLRLSGRKPFLAGLSKIMWIGVAFEDIPQFALTWLVDVHITPGGISPEGMLNFSTAVFNMIVRATESYPSGADGGPSDGDDYVRMGYV